MIAFLTTTLIVACLLLFIFLLGKLEKHLLNKAGLKYDQQFETRHHNPRFDEVEEHLGIPLPPEVKEFYLNNPIRFLRNITLSDSSRYVFEIDQFIPVYWKVISPLIDENNFFPFAIDKNCDVYEVNIDSSSDKYLKIRYSGQEQCDLEITFSEFINLPHKS